jgi:DNA-binding XRE family transcriptional regulator
MMLLSRFMVGEVAKYNSACVNTLRRSWTVTNSPAARGFCSGGRFTFKKGRAHMLEKELRINKFIGQQIRVQRLALKISQYRLADHLGVSYQQLQKIETGKNRVSAARLILISEYFGVSPMDFYS